MEAYRASVGECKVALDSTCLAELRRRPMLRRVVHSRRVEDRVAVGLLRMAVERRRVVKRRRVEVDSRLYLVEEPRSLVVVRGLAPRKPHLVEHPH